MSTFSMFGRLGQRRSRVLARIFSGAVVSGFVVATLSPMFSSPTCRPLRRGDAASPLLGIFGNADLETGCPRPASRVVPGIELKSVLPRILGAFAPIEAAYAADEPAPAQLWTCGMHPQVIRDHPGSCPICGMALTPLKIGSTSGGSTVLIDPVVVQNMGLRTEPVVEGPLFNRIRAVGYLEEAEPNHLDINLRVSGWIEKLYANIDGMHLHEGDPMFDLYSPELQAAIEELIATRHARSAAAESGELTQMAANVERKLELLGLRRSQIEQLAKLPHAPSTVTFYSPMTGHVTEKMVYPGSAVQAGSLVLRLADRSTMWLALQLYEQDLAFVHVGEHVTATVAALPGVILEGDIAFLHPHVDAASRTAMARVVLDNRDGNLRHGMFASTEIHARLSEQALMVPREAVIDTGTRQIAYVALGEGRFEPRPVVMGSAGEDGMVQIVSGLEAGENVVTSGQFLLDAESRLREAIRKHVEQRQSAETSAESTHDQPAH